LLKKKGLVGGQFLYELIHKIMPGYCPAYAFGLPWLEGLGQEVLITSPPQFFLLPRPLRYTAQPLESPQRYKQPAQQYQRDLSSPR
jgi:hypothetical protein